MYSGNDLQAVQLLQGNGYLAVPSAAGTWTQPVPSGSGRKNSKGARGGSASKGLPLSVHAVAPAGRQVAYIDTTSGKLVAQSGSAQSFARPAVQQQPTGRVLGAQPQQAQQTVVQVNAFPQNGQHQQPPQAQPQVLQVHAAPAGPQVYKLTNGTRVVKAGQPYPNTTIVQTAVAVPTGPQQQQPQQQQQQQQVGVITIRPQGMQPLQQQQGLQQSQPPPQQGQLNPQGPILQLQLGGAVQLTAAGAAQQQPGQPLQQATLTLLQQAPQPHVLVAQPQQQVQPQQQILQQQPQQQPQLLQGKHLLPNRQSSAPATFQAMAVRPVGAAGAGAAIRPPSGVPNTLQPAVYTTAPSTTTTIVRPAVRIPKLGTVATYNPVTGVRSATTSASGGATMPLLPANLPATLVQQVQKANLLQQQQQQQSAAAAAAASGGLAAMLQAQPQQPQHLQGQAVVRSVGTINGLVAAGSGGVGNGASQQRQTTLVVGGTGGGLAAAGVQGPQSHMGMAVLGGALQQQHVMHPGQGPMHMVAAAGGAQMQQQQLLLPQQQQQQVVNITLADGTTATTVMDQATLTRMLSESSRGQAIKLQQQQQRQQQQSNGTVGPGSAQGQLQAMQQLQQQQQQTQQMLLQAAPQQLTSSGLLSVLAGNGGGSKGLCGVGTGGSSAGGALEQLGAVSNGPAQLLIRSGSSSGSQTLNGAGGTGGSGRGQPPPPPPGLSQGAQLRAVQMVGPSGSHNHGNLLLQPQQQQPQQADMVAGAQQHQMLQQQLQQSLEQELQHQLALGRRPSGQGLGGEVDSAAALLDPSSMALAQFQRLQQQPQMQQQQMSSVVDGLSVVDLDGTVAGQQRLQQQQLSMVGSSAPLQQRPQPGFMMLQDDSAAAAAMTAANFSLGSIGSDAAAAANLVGAGASSAGGLGLGLGSSREDLKAILVSIGQELARHGISVETAVTSGWLGVLTAMDVAVLADAYTEEERRLMMQQKQPQQQLQQQAQPQSLQQRSSQAGAQGGASDGASLPPQQQQLQLQQSQGPGGEPGAAGADCRSSSTVERGFAANTVMAALTSSSARTSMSVAPSDDGASTASGGGLGLGPEAQGAQQAQSVGAGSNSGGGGGGSMYELGKFNPFQYGFLGAGMLPALGGGGDASSELERLPAGGSEADRDGDAAAMADVFGEKPWPPFGMSVMAEEIGLSAQPHLQSLRHHFPPPHASALLGGRAGGCGAGPKLIDSASEYEARHPLLQQQQQHMGSGAGRLNAAADRQPSAPNGGGEGLGMQPAMSAPAAAGGAAASKGYSSAPGGMFASVGAGSGGAPLDLDKEIENRFANLDLGCGFY